MKPDPGTPVIPHHEGADPPTRVLMVLKRPHGLRGMQQQALRVAGALRAGGSPVLVLGHSRKGRRRPGLWDPTLPVEYVVAPGSAGFAVGLFRYLWRRREEYDAVHVHGLGVELLVAIAARRVTGRPLVVKPSTAGTGTKLDAYGRWTRALPPLARVWRGVDAWICISEQTRAGVLRLGARPERVHSIPNGVDSAQFHLPAATDREAQRAAFGLEPDDVVVCTAAQLMPRKRVDLLLRVFLDLAPEFPRARLWVLGKGEQLEALERTAGASPHGDRVAFLGRRPPEEVALRFQSADLFALLSLWEGLPNALLEAMACGLPAVVTRVSGMEDVVRDRKTGLVVPVDDGDAVRDALRALLANAALRVNLGHAAAAAARAEFGLESTAARLTRVYQECRARAGEFSGRGEARRPEQPSG